MTLRFLIRSAALLTLFAAVAGAQTSVTTDPVGFASVNCPSNSDTFASIPFTRPPEFVGSLQTVSTDTLSVSGSPWAANQFVYAAGTQPKTYYVILGKASTVNPKEGSSYLVTANGTNTLTINLQGDNLSTVPAGTQITVIPYATLASVFPAGDANVSFVPSPSLFSRQTEILIPSYGASGTNLAAAATYFFFNGAWRKFGTDSTQDHGDDPLANNGYVIIRNAGTASKLTANGAVSLRKETVQIVSRSATQQDNFVSVTRPVNVALNDLGLISSGAFASSPSLFNRTDELYVFDNTQVAINKSATATYFYYNGAWRKFSADASVDYGTDVIPAGTGFVIRKAQGSEAVQNWLNAPTYL